ncbi:hypothetical protein HORIV_46820 [Vreelandella olivaria]|uniref:EamA domain-containing protein n=1 Tax=Vreelandella olivaria TaxID=390919 RepID=A0ABN5X637_9GAMM|nr:hypothetical protein HORIV_46820 [Halomonas olivaria]
MSGLCVDIDGIKLSLLNPFFGVLLAYLILGEPLRVTGLIGAALIVIGLFLSNQARARAPQC